MIRIKMPNRSHCKINFQMRYVRAGDRPTATENIQIFQRSGSKNERKKRSGFNEIQSKWIGLDGIESR